MWQTHPWLGFGIGSYGLHFAEYRDPALSLALPFNYWNLDHAHNEFLEIAVETGLVGLILYAALILCTFYLTWTYVRKNRSRDNLLLLGLLGGMAGILIHNCFTVTLRHTPSAFLLWSFLGLCLGAVKASPSARSQAVRRASRFLLALALLAFPYLQSRTLANYIGDLSTVRGIKLMNDVKPETGSRHFEERVETILTHLQRGKRLSPDLYESYNYLGVVYGWCRDYPQQQEVFQELAALNPHFTNVNLNLCVSLLLQAEQVGKLSLADFHSQAFLILAHQKVKQAITWINQAIEGDPLEPVNYHKLARCHLALQQRDEAREAYRKFLKHAPARPRDTLEKEIREAETFLAQAESPAATESRSAPPE
jgi:tetratricopeptide (TPR) repeat protein